MDSSTVQGQFAVKSISRIHDRLYLQSYGSQLKLLDLLGNILTPEYEVSFGSIAVADSTIYNAVNLGLIRQIGDTSYYSTRLGRYTRKFETIFSFTVETSVYGQFYSFPTPVVADGKGGFYSILAFASSDSTGTKWTGHLQLQHANEFGAWPTPLIVNGIDRPFAASSPDGSLAVYNAPTSSYVQKYNTSSQPVWSQPVMVLSSLNEVENMILASDMNGGLILAFWRTLGGIYAQHSGRNGRVGVLTSIAPDRNGPFSFRLNQNYPNPFNSRTTISFSLPERSLVGITVFDILGRKAAEPIHAQMEGGDHQVEFNAERLSSGVFFYQLVAGSHRGVKRMVLLK